MEKATLNDLTLNDILSRKEIVNFPIVRKIPIHNSYREINFLEGLELLEERNKNLNPAENFNEYKLCLFKKLRISYFNKDLYPVIEIEKFIKKNQELFFSFTKNLFTCLPAGLTIKDLENAIIDDINICLTGLCPESVYEERIELINKCK